MSVYRETCSCGAETQADRYNVVEDFREVHAICREAPPGLYTNTEQRLNAFAEQITRHSQTIQQLEEWARAASDTISQLKAEPAPQGWDDRPHSRACGTLLHEHGDLCAPDCPTCYEPITGKPSKSL